MAKIRSATVRLADGRSLGYAECGDTDGSPVLYFHSFPSCRFEAEMPGVTDAAANAHARLLMIERPGLGLSTFRPNRRILDWPNDVSQLADRLSLDRFPVLGISGGGPYAAACACKLPDRVTAAGVVSGIGPLDVPDSLVGMRWLVWLIFAAGRNLPWIIPAAVWCMMQTLVHHKDGVSLFDRDEPELDRATRTRPGISEAFIRMHQGAFAQGWRGVALDLRLLASPWGFDPREIRVPVLIWHGQADDVVPPSHARRLHRMIPGSTLWIYPDEGHHSLALNHTGRILRELMRSSAESRKQPAALRAPSERSSDLLERQMVQA